MNRWTPALGVLLLCLGLLLIVGVRPVTPGPAPATVAAPATVGAVTASPVSSPSAVTPSATASATPRPTIAPGYRVKLPRLVIDMPIEEGDVERDTVRRETPNDFAFHLPGTAIPGERGNSYIYAHARVGMFLSLWNVRVGDEVVIVTPDARQLRYVVNEIHPRVDPYDISWAQPTVAERLTLQTSTGPSPTDPLFVVVASRA